MANLFLSYDRDDVIQAQRIAAALEQHGHSVWWDRHIKGGTQYSKEIEQALNDADAVIVLWSERSVESGWVRDEAAAGRDRGRLLPIKLDRTEPPLGFRQYQAIDLSRWRGREKSSQMRLLLDALDSLVAETSATGARPAPIPRTQRAARTRRGSWLMAIALIAAAAVIAATAFWWRPWDRGAKVPTVAVGPAEPSAAAKTLARDLLVKLGSLQSARSGSMRLVENRGKRADLFLEAAGSPDGRQGQPTLTVLAGRDRSLLWSKQFHPTANTADLNQQLAYTAARVLNCAWEALNTGSRRLPEQALKSYLNGCAQHAELVGADPAEIVPIFLGVVEAAPWFEPAWAKLLSTESSLGRPADPAARSATIARIQAHITQARKLNPNLAEAVLAEINLIPRTAIVEKLRLIERASVAHPDNPNVLAARALLLGLVGRGRDAVEAAKRASQLEPLSPAIRHGYISALAYTGQTETAFAELRKAEGLWPGASNMNDARFRLHFRYGDPREALRLMRSGAVKAPPSAEVILAAKIDPTTENLERAKTLIRNAVVRYQNMATGPLQGYPEFGIEDELHDVFHRWPRIEPDTMAVLFRPAFRKFQRDRRFMQLAARSGLIGYWRETDRWPDFCFDPDLPYECKAEAAKLRA
jgi:hypothetical protein